LRISELEERLLTSPEAPIVLLQRWSPPLAPSVARAIQPRRHAAYSPLHHLLLRHFNFPSSRRAAT